MATVRRALDARLLQDNNDFWDKNPMTKAVQDVGRRNQQAMQVYLRLFLLAASNGESVCATHVQACTAFQGVCGKSSMSHCVSQRFGYDIQHLHGHSRIVSLYSSDLV